jgi:hypothetical protein
MRYPEKERVTEDETAAQCCLQYLPFPITSVKFNKVTLNLKTNIKMHVQLMLKSNQ